MNWKIILIVPVFLSLAYVVHAEPQTSISTDGLIESKSGGFKFPDGVSSKF